MAADLLQDINQTADEGFLATQMSAVAEFAGQGYFVESSSGRGTSLYRTDGSQAGTTLVKQLDSQLRQSSFNARVVGQQLFFTIPTDNGLALWRTDGTEAGTRSLATLQNVDMVAFNNLLYFSGYHPETGSELWSSDGTTAGTRLVQDSLPGPASGNAYSFSQLGSRLLFAANNGTGERVWSADTSGNIQLLSTQANLQSTFSTLGSFAVFSGAVDGNDTQLWRTDGTIAGTAPFVDLVPGEGQVSTVSAVVGNYGIVTTTPFSTQSMTLSAIDSSGNSITLLTRNSTGQVLAAPVLGSKVLLSFLFGQAPELFIVDTSGPLPTVTSVAVPGLGYQPQLSNATTWNDAWYFPAITNTSISFSTDLWRVAAGSAELSKLEDGSTEGSIGAPLATSAGVYWADNAFTQPSVLRFTGDGTSVQTAVPEFLNNFFAVRNLAELNDQVLFTGWGADGSALRRVNADLSTSVVSAYQAAPTFSSLTIVVTPADLAGRRYFFANTTTGPELWRTDGTTAGTVRISNEINPYVLAQLVATTNHVFVVGADQNNQVALWRINDPASGDGTTRGLERIIDLPFNSVSAWAVGDNLVLDGLLNGTRTFLLSDGTSAGTVPFSSLSSINEILSPVIYNNRLYFSARDGLGNATLWRTDGTNAGTQLISSNPLDAWFKATTDGTNIFWSTLNSPAEIFRSDDGVATRTKIAEANVDRLAAIGGVLYYTSRIDIDHWATYRTDGSINPPELVAINDSSPLDVGLTPVPGGMLISGVVSNQYQVRLATLGQPLAVQPEYNLFSADLALYWGSPKLGSVAVGPVFFTDYGNEPAVVRLAPQLSLSQQVVEENRPAGVIGQLTTDWFASTTPINYSLVGGVGAGDNASFTLTTSGLLSANVAFDADLRATRSIRVRASNADGTIAEQSILIRIRDVFDGIEAISLSNNRVAENSANGTVVGIISSQAPQGITASYALVSVNGQTTNLPFAIVGDQLRVAGALDYEAQRTLQLVVQATGSNGSVAIESLTVQLTNVNENATAPLSISLDTTPENSLFEATLGVPSSTAAWTFSLVGGAGDYDNQVFAVDGNTLKLLESPDFESRDDYSVRVRATSGATVIEASLTVVITPVDEFDPQDILFISEFATLNWPTLFENIPSGEIAARLKVVDADRGENYVFSGQFFGTELLAIIQGDALYSVTPANYERDNGISQAFVNATFGGKSIGRSGGSSVTVIGDRNDPPIASNPNPEQDVTAGGTTTFSLPAGLFNDEDFFDQLTVTASYNAGPLPTWLSFNPASLEFVATPAAGDAGRYQIALTATDRAGAQASTNLVLTVLSGQVVAVAGTPANDNFTITALGGPGGTWTIARNGAIIFTGAFLVETPIQISDIGGTDTLVIQASTGSNTIDLRDGRITLDGRRVLFDGVESPIINGRGGNDTFKIISPSAAARSLRAATGVSITGGPGTDTLIGGDTENLWTISGTNAGQLNSIRFSGIENLVGGANGDRFAFDRRGSISGTINGGGGANSLDFSSDNRPSEVVITSLVPGLPITGSAAGMNAFLNIQQFTASSSASGRITGPESVLPVVGIDWQVSQTGGSISSVAGAPIGLRQFGHYRGGNSQDTFKILDPANEVIIDGGGNERNTISYTTTPAPIVDLRLRAATGVRRFSNILTFDNSQVGGEVRGSDNNTTWQIDSQTNQITTSQGFVFQNFSNLYGGAANDTFLMTYDNYPPTLVHGGGGTDSLRVNGVPGDQSTWVLDGVGSGTVTFTTRGITTAFSSVENLVPSSTSDSVEFATQPTREWFRSITSPSGNDTHIVYRGTSSVPLMVNLQDRWATGIRQFDGNAKFVSQTGLSVVMGRNADVTWQVDTSTGQVNDGNWSLVGFSTILAGWGSDRFSFTTSSPQSLIGPLRIDGGEGRNTLDFGGYATGVVVDLQAGTTSVLPNGISRFTDVVGSAFDDVIQGNSQNNWLYGFGGNDILRGQQGDDVLLGGTGDDTLFGNSGNDLLVGGSGQDWLYGGSGDDLLISGQAQLLVDENSNSGLQVAALQAIMNEWTSGRSYATRLGRLRTGVGPGASFALNASTIASDNQIDRVFGEAGDDWFWLGSEDLAPDINNSRERRG